MDVAKIVKNELIADYAIGKNKWNLVNRAWERQLKCEDCPYCVPDETFHPYGEGWAMETLIDCSLGSGKYDQPEDCAGYEIELDAELDKAEAAAYEMNY